MTGKNDQLSRPRESMAEVRYSMESRPEIGMPTIPTATRFRVRTIYCGTGVYKCNASGRKTGFSAKYARHLMQVRAQLCA
jgi:hypothetical protein